MLVTYIVTDNDIIVYDYNLHSFLTIFLSFLLFHIHSSWQRQIFFCPRNKNPDLFQTRCIIFFYFRQFLQSCYVSHTILYICSTIGRWHLIKQHVSPTNLSKSPWRTYRCAMLICCNYIFNEIF